MEIQSLLDGRFEDAVDVLAEHAAMARRGLTKEADGFLQNAGDWIRNLGSRIANHPVSQSIGNWWNKQDPSLRYGLAGMGAGAGTGLLGSLVLGPKGRKRPFRNAAIGGLIGTGIGGGIGLLPRLRQVFQPSAATAPLTAREDVQQAQGNANAYSQARTPLGTRDAIGELFRHNGVSPSTVGNALAVADVPGVKNLFNFNTGDASPGGIIGNLTGLPKVTTGLAAPEWMATLGATDAGLTALNRGRDLGRYPEWLRRGLVASDGEKLLQRALGSNATANLHTRQLLEGGSTAQLDALRMGLFNPAAEATYRPPTPAEALARGYHTPLTMPATGPVNPLPDTMRVVDKPAVPAQRIVRPSVMRSIAQIGRDSMREESPPGRLRRLMGGRFGGETFRYSMPRTGVYAATLPLVEWLHNRPRWEAEAQTALQEAQQRLHQASTPGGTP